MPAAARDLATLANVKAYLDVTVPDKDPLFQRLITAMSSAFVGEVGREILRKTYSETMDEDDERVKWDFLVRGFAIDLKGPVIGDMTSVTVNGDVVAKRATLQDQGWVLIDRYRLELLGVRPVYRVGSIVLVYDGGEHVPSEVVTVPGTPYQVQALQALGTFYSDAGVSYVSSGAALTKVTSNPAVGQYTVSATGLYTFAAADTAVSLSLAYAYLPADVEQCVTEMVAYSYRKRERLDHVSANLGGQSVFFTRDAWPPTIQRVIDRWSRINA